MMGVGTDFLHEVLGIQKSLEEQSATITVKPGILARLNWEICNRSELGEAWNYR